MKFKIVMEIKAIVCLGFGLVLLFVPNTLMSLLGTSLGEAGIFMARVYGATLFGNMFLTWQAKTIEESVAKKAIIKDLFVYDAIGFIVALSAQLSGLFNALGWTIVIVYLFFTIGFGYQFSTKKV
ncbi:hypothetical protein ACFL46_01875 [Candidatus Neomarinimicrobiota bacterium]